MSIVRRTLFSDEFNRTTPALSPDGSGVYHPDAPNYRYTAPADCPLGPDWNYDYSSFGGVGARDWAILNGELRSWYGSSMDYAVCVSNAANLPANQWAEIVYNPINAENGGTDGAIALIFRLNNSGAGHVVIYNALTGEWFVSSFANASDGVQLSSGTGPILNLGDRFRVEAIDNSFTLYVNDTSIGTASTLTQAAGAYVGLGFNGQFESSSTYLPTAVATYDADTGAIGTLSYGLTQATFETSHAVPIAWYKRYVYWSGFNIPAGVLAKATHVYLQWTESRNATANQVMTYFRFCPVTPPEGGNKIYEWGTAVTNGTSQTFSVELPSTEYSNLSDHNYVFAALAWTQHADSTGTTKVLNPQIVVTYGDTPIGVIDNFACGDWVENSGSGGDVIDTGGGFIQTGTPKVLMLDYRFAETAGEIESRDSVRVSPYTGKMLVIELSRKFSPWTVPAIGGGTVTSVSGPTPVFGDGSGRVYSLKRGKYQDDDYGIIGGTTPAYYVTSPFVNAELEQALQLGNHRHLFTYLTVFVSGVGKLVITPLADRLGNAWPQRGPYSLTLDPDKELEIPLDVAAMRAFFKFHAVPLPNSQDTFFSVSRMVVTMKNHPLSPIRGAA